jgi:hypothetical protein
LAGCEPAPVSGNLKEGRRLAGQDDHTVPRQVYCRPRGNFAAGAEKRHAQTQDRAQHSGDDSGNQTGRAPPSCPLVGRFGLHDRRNSGACAGNPANGASCSHRSVDASAAKDTEDAVQRIRLPTIDASPGPAGSYRHRGFHVVDRTGRRRSRLAFQWRPAKNAERHIGAI